MTTLAQLALIKGKTIENVIGKLNTSNLNHIHGLSEFTLYFTDGTTATFNVETLFHGNDEYQAEAVITN